MTLAELRTAFSGPSQRPRASRRTIFAHTPSGTQPMMFPPGSQVTLTLIVLCGMCIVEMSLIGHYVLVRLAGVG
jgi:hypothetical protein